MNWFGVLPSGNVDPLDKSEVTDGSESHASVTVGVLKVTTNPFSVVHSMIISSGVAISGNVVSCTVTTCDTFFSLPEASVAQNMFVVLPSGNIEPLGIGNVTNASESHASVTMGVVKKTTAPFSLVHSMPVILGGAVISGGVVSDSHCANR
jgi:hypothetical protein